MNILNKILDFIFPDTCLGCGYEGALLCVQCIYTIPRAETSEHGFINPLFSYQSPVIKEVIWRLKYKDVKRSAKIFGRHLYEKLIEVTSDEISFSHHESVLLVPIPLYPKRERERGYNQSELLAHALKEFDGADLCVVTPNILKRTRETETQAHSEKRTTRFKNLSNAFTCSNPNAVRGRYVVLIDDVTTTGATLIDAKRALEEAGARTIIAITLAH